MSTNILYAILINVGIILIASWVLGLYFIFQLANEKNSLLEQIKELRKNISQQNPKAKITYLSNSLTNDESAAIPKLAEEAMYGCMVYSILANRENTNPNLLQRLLIEKIDKLERSKSRLVLTNFSS